MPPSLVSTFDPRGLVNVAWLTRIFALALVLGQLSFWLPVAGECRFPSSWSGSWFQSGVRHTIKIDGNSMTSKGTCVQSEGEKFVMQDRHERCYRCIVVYKKHENVLQYKETFCDSSNDTLAIMCAKINGDALLQSMFRLNAAPMVCPIRGPLTFSYNRGHGECNTPVSSIDSCSDEYRLLFRFQACPDVPGTESTAEELVCLATWREGSMRYLVGRLEHSLVATNEDRFRCFVFNKLKSMYYIAQSGDATCNGLISTIEGPKTMKLFRANYPPSMCHFPNYAIHGLRWHRLDGLKTYVFNQKYNHTFTILNDRDGVQEAHVRCLDEGSQHMAINAVSKHVMTFTTHVIMGCTSGYACMSFVKRSSHVLEVQTGSLTRYPNEACEPPNFERSKSEYTTLVAPTPERIRCPYKGQYVAPPIAAQMTTVTAHTSLHNHRPNEITRHTCSDTLTVRVGCASEGDLMELKDDCMPEPKTEAFHCHGAWEENGTSYLIASLKGTKHRYCFIYAEIGNLVKFTSVRKSCKRDIQPGIGGTISFNVTSQGQCDPDYNKSSTIRSNGAGIHWLLWITSSLLFLVSYTSKLNR